MKLIKHKDITILLLVSSFMALLLVLFDGAPEPAAADVENTSRSLLTPDGTFSSPVVLKATSYLLIYFILKTIKINNNITKYLKNIII